MNEPLIKRKTAVVLNVVLIGAYVSIMVFARTPWVALGGTLLLAVAVRSATLCWLSILAGPTDCRGFGVGLALANLVLGSAIAAGIVAASRWLASFWLAGVKIIVPLIVVFVAYKSLFPISSLSSNQNDNS